MGAQPSEAGALVSMGSQPIQAGAQLAGAHPRNPECSMSQALHQSRKWERRSLSALKSRR